MTQQLKDLRPGKYLVVCKEASQQLIEVFEVSINLQTVRYWRYLKHATAYPVDRVQAFSGCDKEFVYVAPAELGINRNG